MDALSSLLRGVRAAGVILSGLTQRPPWELKVDSGAALTLCSPLRGQGWLELPDGVEPMRLRTGDTAIVRGPSSFSFVDAVECDTERPCAEVCRDASTAVGTLRDAEGAHDGVAALLVAKFPVGGEVGKRLLGVLPPVLVVPADPSCEAILDYIAGEIMADRPRQQVVLERLLDWILVCTLRAWFDSAESAAPAWYLAMADPVVGSALRAIHDDHAQPWTVASLARASGVSRASLAKRFTELVGEPPLTYLTGWRMVVAADLLAEPGATVAGVARRVGYADPFGFSSAFKRTRGISPSEFRRSLGAPRELVNV